MDLAIAPTSKEAQLLHRYEREHEKALYAAIRGLLALEKSGADLPDEPAPEPIAAPAGPEAPAESDAKHYESIIYGELASVGAAASIAARPAHPGRPAGSRGRPGRPIGADPGPSPASKRA